MLGSMTNVTADKVLTIDKLDKVSFKYLPNYPFKVLLTLLKLFYMSYIMMIS